MIKRKIKELQEKAKVLEEELNLMKTAFNAAALQRDVAQAQVENFKLLYTAMYDLSKAKNYQETRMTLRGQAFTVTVQRVEGKTPGTVAQEAIDEKEKLEAVLEDLFARLLRLELHFSHTRDPEVLTIIKKFSEVVGQEKAEAKTEEVRRSFGDEVYCQGAEEFKVRVVAKFENGEFDLATLAEILESIKKMEVA